LIWELVGTGLTLAGVIIGYAQTRRKVAEIHVLVNSQLHEVLDRVTQLTVTLEDAGVPVPDKPKP
jgi:1-aminocyclopropane-1-carboxylate deaminase/D-cysteine desulfhydrase-like pyridoxal-dependent ACC family enzyme